MEKDANAPSEFWIGIILTTNSSSKSSIDDSFCAGISAVEFNAVFGKLICFSEVTGSNANNVKAWHKTFSVEDA